MTNADTMRKWVGATTLLLVAIFAVASTALAQEVTVKDNITSDRTWSSDTTYVLDGLVFVGPSTKGGKNLDKNVTLTIEPGTVIRGLEDANVTTGESGSALIIRRSAKIDAQGTPQNPIIMTSETDNISDPVDQLAGGDPDRGQWGGLIILGEASTNQRDGSGNIIYNNQVEGIDPATNPAQYGGGSASNEDDQDNSGILQYVSIRYGGFAIGTGDEINGLTLGAVGRGTTIDHVEVYANADDGVEWFGGTVHTSHLLAAFVGDDAYDYDQGFRGTGQFWASIHDDDEAGRAGEHDGSDAGALDDRPLARPVISNATYIGPGTGATNSGNDRTFALRDNAGGEYYNSVFTNYPNIAVNLAADGTAQNYKNDDIVFEDNAFYGYGEGSSFSDIISIDTSNVSSKFNNGQTSNFSGNLISGDIGVKSVDINQTDTERNLDPRPIQEIADQSTTAKSNFLAKTATDTTNGEVNGADGNALSKSEYLAPIQNLSYHGAFDPSKDVSNTWPAGWTALFQNNLYLPVEMASFAARQSGESVVLSWKTASERNNSGFKVQRAIGDGSFQSIGFREGAGTTSEAQSYRFEDTSLPYGASTVRYRLKQVDLDGTTHFSEVRTVSLRPAQTLTLKAPAPNPVSSEATVRFAVPKQQSQDVTLSLYNVLGQEVKSIRVPKASGRQTTTLSTSSLASGVYFLRLSTGNTTRTERLTVVK